MKVFPFKIPRTVDESLIYEEDRGKVFYDKFHQHEEIQLSYIARGEGKLVVGDLIHPYKEGDLFLLGSNLPHVFASDREQETISVMKTIYFTPDLFSGELAKVPGIQEVVHLLEKSIRGIQFTEINPLFSEWIAEFAADSGLSRLITFFRMIQGLIISPYKELSLFSNEKHYSEQEGKRMSAILNYTFKHFGTPITLEEIADVASMNKNAFCRYFKQRTRKTYFQFLIEVRIENACRELSRNADRSISEIAENCGFQNISNFNRKFRELKQISPFNYRKEQLLPYKQFMN